MNVVKFYKYLKHHLEEADENYFQHLRFTFTMFWSIFVTSIILLIHGILPFVFTRTSSERVKNIHKIFDQRIKNLESKKLNK